MYCLVFVFGVLDCLQKQDREDWDMKTISYEEALMKSLENPESAAAYLDVAFAEVLSGDKFAAQVFFVALKDVAKSQGLLGILEEPIDALAKDELQYYRVLSELLQPVRFGLRIVATK